jgi:hypothetical protein
MSEADVEDDERTKQPSLGGIAANARINSLDGDERAGRRLINRASDDRRGRNRERQICKSGQRKQRARSRSRRDRRARPPAGKCLFVSACRSPAEPRACFDEWLGPKSETGRRRRRR